MTTHAFGAPPMIARLNDAINRHDLDACLACFDPGYQSEQLLHPDRSFRGQDKSGPTGRRSSAAVSDIGHAGGHTHTSLTRSVSMRSVVR